MDLPTVSEQALMQAEDEYAEKNPEEMEEEEEEGEVRSSRPPH